MKIIVYGIGKNGKKFIREIEEEYKDDIEIIAIMDTYVTCSDFHIPYIKVSEISDYKFSYIVVTPEGHWDEISELLLMHGVEKEKILSLESAKIQFSNFYCNLCKSIIWAWEYLGNDYEVFKHKNIIGASKRRGTCPACGCSDRERYVYYILNNYTQLLDGKRHDVLHFAPEHMLSQKLKSKCLDGYITADIKPGLADVVEDITNLNFGNSKFEYIICNHVMEHIYKEKEAFLELRRCLKPNGILILTVPICWEQETFEDNKITTKEDKIKYYGQEDHVRIYGSDIVERIKKVGFSVSLYRSDNVLSKKEISRQGYIQKDSVLLCKNRN